MDLEKGAWISKAAPLWAFSGLIPSQYRHRNHRVLMED